MQKYNEDKQIQTAKAILINKGADKFKTNLAKTDCKVNKDKTFDITLDYAKQIIIIDGLNCFDEKIKYITKKDPENVFAKKIELGIYTSLCIYRNQIDDVERKRDNTYNHFFVKALKNAITSKYSQENCVEYELGDFDDVETKFIEALCEYNLSKIEVKLGLTRQKLLKDFGLDKEEEAER